MRVLGSGGGFSFVHFGARIAEICEVHKAAMTGTGGDERSARGRMRARSTPAPVSGLSVLPAERAISWLASFCAAARPAGETVKTSNVDKWHSSSFKKVACGRPADGTPWPFYFQVDMRAAGFLRGRRLCCWDEAVEMGEGLATGRKCTDRSSGPARVFDVCRTYLQSTNLVHNGVMRTTTRSVRQSISLPANVASQVRSLAKARRLSASRLLLELIENGMAAEKRKQQEFIDLAERFRNATDPEEVKRLGDQMGRMVFGA